MADEKGKLKLKTKMMNTKTETLLVPADSDLLKPPKVKKEAESPKDIKDNSKSCSVNTKGKLVKKEAESPKEIKDNSKSCSVNTKGKLVKKEAASSEKGHTHDDKSEKKQRKLYDLPGQKRDPPQERDPLRIFYESLYEQRPTSEMAEFWMMEHGLLTPEKAKKVFEKKQKKHPQLKSGSPVKPSSSKKNHQNLEKSSAKDSSKSKKKRAHLSDSDSDELILPKKKLRMS